MFEKVEGNLEEVCSTLRSLPSHNEAPSNLLTVPVYAITHDKIDQAVRAFILLTTSARRGPSEHKEDKTNTLNFVPIIVMFALDTFDWCNVYVWHGSDPE